MARGKSARSKAKSKATAKGKASVKGKANVQGWAPAAVKRRKATRRNEFVASCAELWAFCTRLPVIFALGIIMGVCLGITAAEIDELRLARGPTPSGPVAANETPTGVTSTSETPTGETPTGETPTGETPTGETPTGETPTGETPSAESTPALPTESNADMAVAAGQSDLQVTEPKVTEPGAAESAAPVPTIEPPEPAIVQPVPPLLYTEETEPNAAPDFAIPEPAPKEAPTVASAPLPAAPEPEAATPSPAMEPKPKSIAAEPAPPPAPAPQVASIAPPAAPTPVATPVPEPVPEAEPEAEPEASAAKAPLAADAPTWLKNAVASIDPGQRPMIAVVLDDVGVAPADAELALKLPGAVTLSIMTYAPNVAAFANRARAKGHEIMVHMPMEPVDHSIDPGPNALLVGLTEAEIRRRVIWGLSRFDGYVGINNHMGSRFTQYEPGMRIVMEELKSRGLLFLDSRTIAKSVGDSTAASEGVTHVTRDVFLDNTMSVEAVLEQLKDAEAVARAQGYVVAIGHPHPTTVAALKRWIPQARKAGFVLVPLSEIVKKREGLAG